MGFVKKIVENKIDDAVHRQFIRFGKGKYVGRFLLSLRKSKKIKVKTSFEFANDLVILCSSFGNYEVSGIILSKKDISGIIKKNNIKGNSETKKGGLYYQNNIDKQELNQEQLLNLEKESYFTLLDIEGENFKLKIKKKLPKPGKDENKIDDKFCQLEADEQYYDKIKKDFFWDVPDRKKININHTVIIDQIIFPKEEKDYSKIRELAKRKGKLIRNFIIDGNESSKKIYFEV